MTMEYRTTVSAGDGLTFVISDGSLDRHGTRINPNGWKLSSFNKNPIALFGHDSSFPIGTWSAVKADGGRLIGVLKLAAKGTSERIDELINLVEQGVLRAVSVGFSVLKYGEPGKSDFDFEEQELFEVSLVSVPSNPNALMKARSLNISESTIRMAFGEHADEGQAVVSPGGNAVSTPNEVRATAGLPPLSKVKPMKTLSQRIEDAQTGLNAKKDRLAELTSADTLDVDAIEELNSQIEGEERGIAALKASEARIGVRAAADTGVAAPAVNRRPLGFPQREISGIDLLVRRALVHACSLYSDKDIDKVLEERYPGHEATALVTRAAAPLGTTGNSGFVAELQQVTYASFLDTLKGKSIYPVLRERGHGVSFDSAGTAYLPQRTGAGANGSFFAEGSPIRVGRITVAAPTFTSRKMGVIIPFSREAAKRSTPSLEGVVRQAIIDDTAAVLDSILLDATAGDSIRPAGLLNGVSAVASGYGGGDHLAVKEDFKALLAPFIAANAVDGITVVMNPTQGLSIAMMDGPANTTNWFAPIAQRVNIVESTYATAGRLIALRNTDFATGLGDLPEFELSNQATIHMEDTSPAEIVSATGPTTANPVRSFWQTDSMGVRMVMDVSWKMARSGMVQWIDGTSY